ncbi:MAG: hypothetical protein KGR48_15205 [Alphaproteobacteria bacterium]|nr:hypothetical protein [Alphaproteobacteria bacterium]MDE2013231.1 hypothetical protein [Alphaproteobacteria bacterium]
MTVTGWQHLWTEAMALYAQEPAPIQIALALAAAFTALMVLEGLRVSFLPQGKDRPMQDFIAAEAGHDRVAPQPHDSTFPPTRTSANFGPASAPSARASASFSPKHKARYPALRRQCATRPTIRRKQAESVTEP